MQKKLIALAIAGLSSTAFAQSNVTISGVIKGGYDSTKISGGTAATGSMNQFSDQASNFTLSGSEALGNGLSAIFRIENRFGIDGVDNASNLATGNSHIGLKSATFGEIKMGTQDLHYNEIERIENGSKSLSQQAMVGRGILQQVGGGTNTVGVNSSRTKNVLFWDSPNWSGFTARVAYSTNATGDELGVTGTAATANTIASKQGSAYNLVGRYENGPIKAGVSYLNVESDATIGAPGVQAEGKSTRAWGAYKIAGFSLGLAYDSSKLDDNAGSSRKRDGWAIPLSYQVGNHGVYATYAKANDLETNGVKNNNSGAKQWTLGYSYDLSKRTSVGVNYTKIDNESGANYRFSNSKGANPLGGQDVSQFYAGVRHAF